MKRATLVHGYAGHKQSFWLQNLESELQAMNYLTLLPSYANSKRTQMSKWLGLYFKNTYQLLKKSILLGIVLAV